MSGCNQVINSQVVLKHGEIHSSVGGQYSFRVLGPCCRLYDRNELPWPCCRLSWRSKEPSWRRIGKRFVPDIAATVPGAAADGGDVYVYWFLERAGLAAAGNQHAGLAADLSGPAAIRQRGWGRGPPTDGGRGDCYLSRAAGVFSDPARIHRRHLDVRSQRIMR